MTTNIVERAREIAKDAHKGQMYGSKPYFDYHVLGVYSLVGEDASDEVKAAALLHDVVEDCHVTTEQLFDMGMPYPVVRAVSLLTKKRGQKQFDYLMDIAKNDIALEVKIADATFNARGGRAKYAITLPMLKMLRESRDELEKLKKTT